MKVYTILDTTTLDYFIHQTIEIIGNIYENKEAKND